jgi:hypothetical protein
MHKSTLLACGTLTWNFLILQIYCGWYLLHALDMLGSIIRVHSSVETMNSSVTCQVAGENERTYVRITSLTDEGRQSFILHYGSAASMSVLYAAGDCQGLGL